MPAADAEAPAPVFPPPAPGGPVDDDADFARLALAHAEGALGRTGANPPVACAAARGGRLLARARTGDGGRPHAEERLLAALAEAGESAEGATIYCTLEPCAHAPEGAGEAASCSGLLAAARPARVHALMLDPDPRTAGRGAARLREAGVEVSLERDRGLACAARRLALGHERRVRLGRPFMTLKMATTLDGRIAPSDAPAPSNAAPQAPGATESGDDPDAGWITARPARTRAHMLRAEHDAVLVGSGTLLADDPMLSVRLLPRWGRTNRPPTRVLLDSSLRLRPEHHLARTEPEPGSPSLPQATWVFHREGAEPAPGLAGRPGLRFIPAPPAPGGVGLDLPRVLGRLAADGITRVLAECGGRLAASLLAAGAVDALAWFQAPLILGAEATPAVAPGFAQALDSAPWRRVASEEWGRDTLSLLLSPDAAEPPAGFPGA